MKKTLTAAVVLYAGIGTALCAAEIRHLPEKHQWDEMRRFSRSYALIKPRTGLTYERYVRTRPLRKVVEVGLLWSVSLANTVVVFRRGWYDPDFRRFVREGAGKSSATRESTSAIDVWGEEGRGKTLKVDEVWTLPGGDTRDRIDDLLRAARTPTTFNGGRRPCLPLRRVEDLEPPGEPTDFRRGQRESLRRHSFGDPPHSVQPPNHADDT